MKKRINRLKGLLELVDKGNNVVIYSDSNDISSTKIELRLFKRDGVYFAEIDSVIGSVRFHLDAIKQFVIVDTLALQLLKEEDSIRLASSPIEQIKVRALWEKHKTDRGVVKLKYAVVSNDNKLIKKKLLPLIKTMSYVENVTGNFTIDFAVNKDSVSVAMVTVDNGGIVSVVPFFKRSDLARVEQQLRAALIFSDQVVLSVTEPLVEEVGLMLKNTGLSKEVGILLVKDKGIEDYKSAPYYSKPNLLDFANKREMHSALEILTIPVYPSTSIEDMKSKLIEICSRKQDQINNIGKILFRHKIKVLETGGDYDRIRLAASPVLEAVYGKDVTQEEPTIAR